MLVSTTPQADAAPSPDPLLHLHTKRRPAGRVLPLAAPGALLGPLPELAARLQQALLCMLLPLPGICRWAGAKVHLWRHGKVGVQVDGRLWLRLWLRDHHLRLWLLHFGLALWRGGSLWDHSILLMTRLLLGLLLDCAFRGLCMLRIAEPADACIMAQHSVRCPYAALLHLCPSSKQHLLLQHFLPEDADRVTSTLGLLPELPHLGRGSGCHQRS